jgi:phenylalanyl-tRNA synthetase beta chain
VYGGTGKPQARVAAQRRLLFLRRVLRYCFLFMKTSSQWLNDYLDHHASPEEQAELLTRAGFPIETMARVPDTSGDGDAMLDVEITSNRGDCLSHVGLARELAAVADRVLKLPHAMPHATGPAASATIKVTNREPDRCPLYTARVIRGVKVAPSPDWLASRLRAIGQIPRNSLVDLTNFVLFEMGQPTHVFDLARLKRAEIIIRMATPGELFLPIGEGAARVKLSPDDLVIADAERAVAIAGVKGGAETAVTSATTDILIEAASFDPLTVRQTSRRLGITSDSQFRFERGVAPGSVNAAADRLTALILELCGGELCEGVVADGKPIPELREVSMRLSKCEATLGLPIPHAKVLRWLGVLGFDPRQDGDVVHCTVPAHRLDIGREIDLIEEVCRLQGYDDLPVEDAVRVRITPPQPTEMARRAVRSALVGMSFVETTTHSLISEADAAPFAGSHGLLRMAHDVSRGEPMLRPSIIPSLLRVRRHNAHHGVNELKLFEAAAVFWTDADGRPCEENRLALLADAENPSLGLRPLRGVVEQLARILRRPDAHVELVSDAATSWLAPAATVRINGEACGVMGMLAPGLVQQFDLAGGALAAELELERWFAQYPPEAEAHVLPAFPPIERDVSAIVDETVTWKRIEHCVREAKLPMLEVIAFVTAFRGKQIAAGKKSVTMRLRFRAADRTLQHEEVDPAVDRAIDALRAQLGAEIRETAKS